MSCKHQRSDIGFKIFKCVIKIEEEQSEEDEDEEDYFDSKIDDIKDDNRIKA